MFQRVSSSMRIALINEEKKRIEKLLINTDKEKSKVDLKIYLNYLEEQLKKFECLTKK